MVVVVSRGYILDSGTSNDDRSPTALDENMARMTASHNDPSRVARSIYKAALYTC